ncbi:MAG: hypothetical protein COB53_12850 [Elusimicrobia bacterium]|nr:MAG: hypothetical protein COB53_12850 [Elusimicrobiota bacterium]
MKHALLTFLIALAPLGARAGDAPELGPGRAVIDAAWFTELFQAIDATENVWPGFRFDAFPLLIVDRIGGYSILIGGNAGSISGAATLEFAGRTVWRIPQIYDVPGTFQISRPFAGRDTTWVLLDPEFTRPRKTLQTAIHEHFHHYQDGWAKDRRTNRKRRKLDKATNLALARFEQAALTRALKDDDPDSLYEFAAIRDYRSHSGGLVERKEGTALYVERSSTRKVFGEAEFVPFILQELGRRTDLESLNYGRLYFTGAAIGIILDRAGVAWKKRVEDGETQYDVLRDRIPDANLAGRVDALLQSTAYEDALAKARGNTGAGAAEWEQAVVLFESQTGILLTFALDREPGQRRAFQGRAWNSPNSRDRIAENARSFSENSRWVADVRGALVREPRAVVGGRSLYAIERILPVDASWIVDGEAWEPVPGVTSFENLEISGSEITVRVNGGEIEFKNNRITVRSAWVVEQLAAR